MNFRPRLPRDDGGYSLILATVVSFLLGGILVAGVAPVVIDSRTTGDSRRQTDGRLLAESVLNELYTTVGVSARAVTDTFPALAGRVAPGKRVSDAGATVGWAMFDPATGVFRRCATIRDDCFSYSLQPQAATATAPGQVIVAEVIARVGCRTTPETCTYTKLQQRWRRRAYLDFLMFTVRETLDPGLYDEPATCDPENTNPTTRQTAGCREIAYVGYTPPATTPNDELWVGEAWLRTGGTAWTLPQLFVDDLPRPPASTTFQDRYRAETSTGTVLTVTSGALRAATKVKPNAAGTSNVRIVADEATRVRWQIGGGVWSWADIAAGVTWTSANLTLGPTAALTLEIVAVNETPTTYPSVSFRTGAAAFSELRGTNLSALGLTAATRDLAQGVDLLAGPIHTNDPWFWICGTPSFTGTVESTADPTEDVPTTEDVLKMLCPGTVPTLPTPPLTGPVLELPSSTSPFAAIAGSAWTFAGPASLVFSAGNQVSVNGGTNRFVPPGGVIHVNGSAAVRGTTDQVTVSATGTVTIDGDLTDAESGAAVDKAIDIGIVAGQGIVVGHAPQGRTIEAALVALNGTIRVEGWDTTRIPLTGVPVLTFTGAMAAKFRPVFATFAEDGSLLTGMAKAFTYPTSPPSPPWLLNPVRALWERVELAEFPALTAGIAQAVDPKRTAPVAGCSTAEPADLPYLATCVKP
ncbi:MAG: hypothetical protein ACKO91_18455 [Acidimicrobiales bacterium]